MLTNKKILTTLCTSLIICGIAFAYEFELANQDKHGLGVNSISRTLRLDAEDVDIATAALLISRDWTKQINHRRYRQTIDDMAYEIMENAQTRNARPRDIDIIKEINRYLFDELGFKAIDNADDPEDLFLHSVIDRRQGYCLSLSILYLSLGERLGLPLYGVVVPGHFFVRYDNGRTQFNIEATSNGNTADDKHYIDKFKVPQGGRSSIYMKKLNSLESLGCFFNNLGNCYVKAEDPATAKKFLERSVNLAPGLAEARNNLGNIYFNDAQYRKALTQFQKANRANPLDAGTYNNIANVYLAQDKTLQAIAQYQKAIKIDPNLADAYIGLSRAYRQREMYAAAMNILDKGLELEQGSKWWFEFGSLYKGMGEYDIAMDYFNRALEEKPQWVQAHFEIALIYNNLHDMKNAAGAYRKVLSIDPEMVAAMQNLGNIYIADEKYDKATEVFSNALQYEPKNAALNFALGLIYAKKKDFENAEQYYLQTIRFDRSHKTAYYNLAVCYYNNEQYGLSLEYAQAAAEFGFELPDGLIEELERKTRK